MINVKPHSVYCVITHSDIKKANSDEIQEKLKFFEKYGDIVCPPDHVIEFNNTADSLKPLIEKLNAHNHIPINFETISVIRKA